MTLTLGPPQPELARELEQVRAHARALAAYIGSSNAPFPEDFPKADILAITAEMAELPDGTARGCLPSLEYVDMRLADIRSLHFPAIAPAHPPKDDQHPALTREEGLDRDLSGLMVAIATARRVANRIAAIEPEEKPPEPSVPREAVPGLAEIESKGLRVGDELLEARHEFDEVALPASEPADHFRRTLTDAKVVAGLSRVEMAQESIIPAWLSRFGGWLSDYPARLERAGHALEVGVDIAETLHGGWRNFKKKLTDAAYSSLREFADELQVLGQRLGERRRTTAQVELFAISKVRSKILVGEALPVEWVRFIDELDLSGTPLHDLSAVQTLTALQSLDLSGTKVTDLSPLKTLTALRSLHLSGTKVTDLSALQTLTALRSLHFSGTKVADLSPLKTLTELQSLNLSRTKVTDLSPLKTLTALQGLNLSGIRFTDLSALQTLTALQSLNLSSTNVADLSPLKTLTALQSLDLSFTEFADLSALQTLTALKSLNLKFTRVADVSALQTLTALQRLNLSNTNVADLSPLKTLTALQRLDLPSTKVADLSGLQTLTALQSLDLSFTEVADLSPLKTLPALATLDLTHTAVSDLAALAGLKSLRRLDVRSTMVADTYVLDTSVLAHLEELQIVRS